MTTRPIHAYVHLAHGFDARTWRARWASGELIGINEASPYGYHRAEQHGVRVTFSHDTAESPPVWLLRSGLRALLGFDLVHAWRHRRQILDADVVWTHTESQHLGVAAVLTVGGRRRLRSPRLLAQSVWLFDRWDRLTPFHRALYRRLIRRADVLTVHSTVNLEDAKRLFPHSRAELVRFGICADHALEPEIRVPDGTIHVLGVGNDRHRDWPALLKALGDTESVELRIVSKTIDLTAVSRYPRVEVVDVRDNARLLELYRWADVVVLPLAPNRHASGTTVLQEAVLRGVPAVVSDTGGLRAYFDDDCVAYVPSGDVTRLRSAVLELRDDPARRLRLARAAQARMGPTKLSSESYVRAHCDLSTGMVARTEADRPGVGTRPDGDVEMTNEDLTVAVVLASANRPALLADVLRDVMSQSRRPDHLVVSVPDRTSLPEMDLVNCTVVHAHGLTAQRNAGLDAVPDADIVFFFDDDAVVRRDYIERGVEHFLRHPEVVGLTGNVLLDGAARGEISEFDADAALQRSEHIDGAGLLERRRRTLYGCNFAYRADRTDKIRFDDRLPLYSWLEDHDFARRLMRFGELVRASDCVIVHRGVKSGGRQAHRRFGYAQVMNPSYLCKTGSFPLWLTAWEIFRPTAKNVAYSPVGRERIWRRERLRGNVMATRDVLGKRFTPERAREIES